MGDDTMMWVAVMIMVLVMTVIGIFAVIAKHNMTLQQNARYTALSMQDQQLGEYIQTKIDPALVSYGSALQDIEGKMTMLEQKQIIAPQSSFMSLNGNGYCLFSAPDEKNTSVYTCRPFVTQ
jgi:hypothetical protein